MQLIHKYEAEDVLGKLSDSGKRKYILLLKLFHEVFIIYCSLIV